MAEKEGEDPKKKHVKQPPSVPFLWEERPGMPKKDWKDKASSSRPVPPPAKLVASIPFTWEEKRGKPQTSISQPPTESKTLTTNTDLIGASLPLPPSHCLEAAGSYREFSDDDGNGGSNDETYELDVEPFLTETDDNSFSSPPSVLANCFLSSATISPDTPVQMISLRDNAGPEIPSFLSSPASDYKSSTSSSLSGTSSLVGASFLECLFPPLPPNSGFLEKVVPSERQLSSASEQNGATVDRESKSSLLMEFARQSAFGCGIFGSGSKMLKGLSCRCQLRLKPRS
ncbi:uncharacterized protein LOC115740703 [Rhodamnia argentea]|uniref:Uncharacterized protein LOC115740703 n=1 Tax=Rhodamnia argentea TaxID=178133 RepID=A0A8B8P689_9MYRT|nr:uncharacterized protein LOC115740703 [Rhodamnia argentea]